MTHWLRDSAGAYVVIGLAAGVAAAVLCVRVKDRAAQHMNKGENED